MNKSYHIRKLRERICKDFGIEFYKMYMRWLKDYDNIPSLRKNIYTDYSCQSFRNIIDCLICTCDILNNEMIVWSTFFKKYMPPQTLLAYFSKHTEFEEIKKIYKHHYITDGKLNKSQLLPLETHIIQEKIIVSEL